MKTKITTTTTKAGYLQMIDKADAEGVLLKRQAEELQARLRAAQAEVESLQARATSRLQIEETAKQTIEQLQATIKQAQTQARLAEGTLAAASNGLPSIKDLTRSLQKVSADQTAILERNEREQTRDEARMQVLAGEMDVCRQRLRENDEMQKVLIRTREQAVANLGQAEYEEVAAGLEALRAELAAKEHETKEAYTALERFESETLERLYKWPELRDRAKALFLPYQDETTHVLEKALEFYGLLLTEGPRATIPMHVFRQVVRYGDVLDLLILRENDIWPIARNRMGEALTVRDRKAQFERLLQLYRQHHA